MLSSLSLRRLYLSVRVKPGSKAPSSVLEHAVSPGDSRLHLTVRVQAQAQDNEANEALVEHLAEAVFGVPRDTVEIVRGRQSREKLVHIEGLSLQEALVKLKSGYL